MVRRFTARANKMKSRLEMPPTPSSSAGSPSASQHHMNVDKLRSDDAGNGIGGLTKRNLFEADRASQGGCLTWPTSFCGKNDGNGVLDPQGTFSD